MRKRVGKTEDFCFPHRQRSGKVRDQRKSTNCAPAGAIEVRSLGDRSVWFGIAVVGRIDHAVIGRVDSWLWEKPEAS